MKGNEKVVISGVVVFVLAIAFYMLVLSPKRAEVAELEEEVTSLEASIAEQDQLVAFGEQARKEFPRDYGRLVVLGKAVPDQADSASLLVELNAIAGSSDVQFRGIALGSSEASGSGTTAAAPATTPPATPTPPAEGEAAPAAGDSSSTAAAGTEASATPTTAAPATPAPATEADAANLPIGAVVGTAGLPTLPYTLTFRGGFFGIADYMGQVDQLVQFEDKKGQVHVNGRLMTVDGFALNGGRPGSSPELDASFMLTSYVTPSTQGLTAGATPGGPAPGGVQVTPASTAVTP